MPPDLAGRGFGCRVSSSRKIPAWSKTCQKSIKQNIQNWAKIHQKVGLEADLFSTWNLHPKISKKVGPRGPKWRPKSSQNAPQDALQNGFGTNLGPRSPQGTKSIQNMTSRHPKMVNFWSIFRWKMQEKSTGTLQENIEEPHQHHRKITRTPRESHKKWEAFWMIFRWKMLGERRRNARGKA